MLSSGFDNAGRYPAGANRAFPVFSSVISHKSPYNVFACGDMTTSIDQDTKGTKKKIKLLWVLRVLRELRG
jgi:hypothetical protein